VTVYLDHAATSPLLPAVADAMAAVGYGNASGSHRVARDARRALEEARDEVAGHLGAAPGEIVFTSGGTEADNLAVFGTIGAIGTVDGPVTVVCSAVEHAAVLEPCRALGRRPGVTFLEAPVDADGAVDLGALDSLLAGAENVALVSVMAANNEVGTVQPLDGVVETVRRRAPGARVHTDAVQAAPWLDVARTTGGADLVSVSAHKLGGPKGSGALVVRGGVAITPILYGGGQERERRSGTHDVAAAVGLAAALSAPRDVDRTRALRDRLADGLLAAVPGAVESADRHRILPGHCHLSFPGTEQEELLVLLDEAGICASAGAACASGALEPSHVLTAMGIPPDRVRASVRFTLGHTTTAHDVEAALAAVPVAVARLR
jgi:cysteine desulfurase